MVTAMQRSGFEPWIALLVCLSMPIRIKGVSTSSSHVTVIEGSNLTLSCPRDSPARASVIWNFHSILDPIGDADTIFVAHIGYSGMLIYNMAGAWANDISQTGNSHLVISRLRLDRDEGYFTCSVGSSNNITIQVIVQVPVKTVSLVPTNSVTLSTEQTGTTTFTCKVTSKPRATVTWQIVKTDNSTVTLSGATESINTHDKLTDITSTLSYTPDKEHNGGYIRCTANSPANTSPVYNDTRLIIHYAPDSVRNILGYTGPVTESSASMQLTCSVDRVPNPNNTLTYAWSSGCGTGARSTSQISVSQNRTMNNKQCFCTVRHPETGWQQQSASVTFNIYFGPDSVVIVDKTTVIGIIRTSISATCTGSDSNPIASLNWYNTTGGSKSLLSPDVTGPPQGGTYGQITQSIYRIVPSRYNDGQQITCEGQNPRVPDNKQSHYVIIDIFYPPLLEPQQASIVNKIAVESTQLILTCTAWAKPLADITWTPLQPTSTVNTGDDNYRRTSTFTLPAINRTEIGLYRCSASNDHGSIDSQGFNVIVHYVPDVVVSASTTHATEGGNTQLECHPSAVPDRYTSIYWTQYVNRVNVRELSVSSMSRVLSLNNLAFEDAGEYRCSVTNIVGTGTGKKSITIKYAPKLVGANDVSSGINGTATLSLTFIGDPQPNVTWYKDESNSSLDDSSQRFSTRIVPTVVTWTFYDTPVTISGYEATLTILFVEKQDYAAYHATIDNGLKSDLQIPRFSARLILNDKPQRPSDFKAVCDVTTVVVSWVSQFSGGLPQTFHLFYSNNEHSVAKTEQDPGKGNTGAVEVEELKAGRNYTFVIFARNILGDSRAVTTSCQTKETVVSVSTPSPDAEPSTVVVVAVAVAVPMACIIVILIIVICIVLRRHRAKKPNIAVSNVIILSDVTNALPDHNEDNKDAPFDEIHNIYNAIVNEDNADHHNYMSDYDNPG